MVINEQDYLEHYGILGMKWGRRKGTTSSSKPKKAKKTKTMSAKQKKKILNSPTKLYANRKKFTKEEIDKAMNKFKWERELRNLSHDEIQTGSRYANDILAYGTAAAAAYGLYKSPLGQTIVSSIKKR